MNDVAILSVSLMAGILIGAFFFGGLWWTVQKSLTSIIRSCGFSAARCCVQVLR